MRRARFCAAGSLSAFEGAGRFAVPGPSYGAGIAASTELTCKLPAPGFEGRSQSPHEKYDSSMQARRVAEHCDGKSLLLSAYLRSARTCACGCTIFACPLMTMADMSFFGAGATGADAASAYVAEKTLVDWATRKIKEGDMLCTRARSMNDVEQSSDMAPGQQARLHVARCRGECLDPDSCC